MEEHSKVNVLVATDVVKEYIDVRNCSCVICFDLPKTVRSFIQSRGRVRQNKSNFILLLERGNEKQQKLLYEIIRSEESMKETTVNSNLNHIPCIQEQSSVETNVYRVSSSGATVTCDSSVSLIYKYCAKLPEDANEKLRDEVFKPVCCSVCETEVAVLDENEIYHAESCLVHNNTDVIKLSILNQCLTDLFRFCGPCKVLQVDVFIKLT